MGNRWYDAQLGRWISADTIVPEPAIPQSWNRYAYALNNPQRYVDPSGHISVPWDCARNPVCRKWAEKKGDEDGEGVKVDEKTEPKFALVEGYGSFDLKHLKTFPGHGQAYYWSEFQRRAKTGESFSYGFSMPQDYESQLTIIYSVSAFPKRTEKSQYEGVAMAIFQHYAREFEAFQLIISNFANQDTTSDYLGLVAAMRGRSPESMLWELGKVSYRYTETPSRGFFCDATCNYEFTPRVCEGGSCHNISWPADLQVDPINDPALWRPLSYYGSYAGGLVWIYVIYNEDGSPALVFPQYD